MTERLYYSDPYTVEFDAEVVHLERSDSRVAAVLDRTAFYPTSGGQPFDTGTIGEARVVDVIDRDDGTILHVLDRDVRIGRVHGRIDWDRRFEHMQQHTGQHVLSAAFDRLIGVRTESFHLGAASSTIDLATPVTPDDLHRAVLEANRIVWEDRPVSIRFADAAESAKLPLRKEPVRGGVLRLIEVQDFDMSACGGTHVARTGAIGIIAVASWDRFRGGTRVEFLCGVRALRGYAVLRDAVAASVRLVSVLPGELPAGIERLQADVKDTKRIVKDLQLRLASFEAGALAARARTLGSLRLVVESLAGWDANGLKMLASAVVERPGHVVGLFSLPTPSAVVIACAPDAGVDCAGILKRLTEKFGGKGGGRAQFAQGGGLQGPAEDMRAFVEAAMLAM